LAGEGRPHITLCGRNSVQIHERHRPVDFKEMTQRLNSLGVVRHNDFVLKFWRDPFELTLFPDGRAIIKGTTDTAVARSLYARYVGSQGSRTPCRNQLGVLSGFASVASHGVQGFVRSVRNHLHNPAWMISMKLLQ